MKKLFQRLLNLIAFVLPVLIPAVIHAVTPQVAAGLQHTVGLKADGTVVACLPLVALAMGAEEPKTEAEPVDDHNHGFSSSRRILL